ncbi:MAG: 16S rRNA (guanine(527)-N(7))-methyltransferase RsmG [Clostridiales bacterium]|nr:16S rRNA (guanine(527)-N(7))-methyltransferase RsmG [Clostridiales bacterium]
MDLIRNNYRLYLREHFQKIGIALSELQVDQFLLYYELLIEKNKVMNLTAITKFEDVVQKHFIDSVLILYPYDCFLSECFCTVHLDDTEMMDDRKKNHTCHSLIDVGTGAGFPGIPLKILCPDFEILLLDSLNKRVLFLEEVISKLKLERITAIHARAEEAARDLRYREQFDFCVSRAVANLSSLSEYCLPFVKREGYFISYKSAAVDQECLDAKKAIFLLGGKMMEIRKVSIPDTDIERSFIYIKKERGTSIKYPRKAGIPSKSPL